MDPIVHEVAECGVDLALPIDAAQPGKGGAFDDQREMALAARVVAGVPDMLVALVIEHQPGRRQRGRQPLDHLGCDGSGGDGRHRSYIMRFRE